MITSSCLLRHLFAVVLLVLCCTTVPAQQAAASIPDFTAGDKPGEAHDWTLGPTGARGWIHTSNGHSAAARQILVTAVAPGSPVDGVLRVGDVILGVDGQRFTDDARIRFAQAVMTAESERGAGKLRVLRWRSGATDEVVVTLPVLGSYSATAPYDCAKSQRILTLGCASLAKRMSAPDYGRGMYPIPRALNALALLAGGNAEHLPVVRTEARWAADFSVSPEGFQTWPYGYVMMFLAEYVIATGDQSVIPGLKRLALESANGQSAVGTWGHKFALPNGNLSGYGCMNQPGITLCIGMALAREAGVKDPVLDRAITKAAGFLRWYVDKGAVPYGDHQPFPGHEDNGKCSSSAVLFDLLADREATDFFARMSTAAYDERERGHTGNYFNVLWALFGVARSGPLATGAYLKETAWYYDLARGWDGMFLYQGSPVGEEEHGKYKGWDCSGSYLLAYALSRKSLLLTGKKPFCAPALDATQVKDVIAAGRDIVYKKAEDAYLRRTTEQLLAGLSSWSPLVRNRSAAALGKRDAEVMPQLLALLSGKDRYGRYGACKAIGALGPRADAAAPQVRALLTDPDPWLQALACEALPALSDAVRKASVSDLLSVVVRPNPADPRRTTARIAATALFAPFPGAKTPRSILADSLDGVDRALLYPAIESLLRHEDSVPRSSVQKVFKDLNQADLAVLLPAIVRAVEKLAPSNEMFGDGIRLAGLDLLSRLHVREGMPLCVAVIEPKRWGLGGRLKRCLEYLPRYGTHAKVVLPELKEARAEFIARGGKKVDTAGVEMFDRCIKAIETATATPMLIGVAEFSAKTPGK